MKRSIARISAVAVIIALGCRGAGPPIAPPAAKYFAVWAGPQEQMQAGKVMSADSSMPGAHIRDYGLEILPAIDRMITTSAPMDTEHTANTLQPWQLSDFKLLKTVTIIKVDAATGALSWDDRFHDSDKTKHGVSFARTDWPHGQADHVVPHGARFISQPNP